ncbi:unnamed protein product [Paramecium pentaurelia]|uniref:AN1-type domain-containing protein n=1 Tax=Paramecium pentaurelia TaxID=43138 RepID=A0A8S1SKE4_9CILI|nr:unnamed protein product [Paramecium pentaurelia]
MQNNQQAATEEQSKNQEVKQETKQCPLCQTFFGSAKTNFYCSQCYKTISQKTNEQQPQQQQQQQIPEDKAQSNQQVNVQQDPSKCYVCKRKLGISGIQCKCKIVFCNKHRLPEDHNCTYDHAEKARQLLIKNNPLVDHKKLEEL